MTHPHGPRGSLRLSRVKDAARPLIVGLAMMAFWPAPPALAATVGVTSLKYDDAKRLITIGIEQPVSVRTQRIKHPDRLIIDLSEARMPPGSAPLVALKSARLRSVRIGQHSYVPAVVRMVVELVPGFEPRVTISQPSGKLLITLADPAPPRGERDLENLPGFPLPGTEPPGNRPDGVLPGSGGSSTVSRRPAVKDAPIPEVITMPAPAAAPQVRPAPAPSAAPAPRTFPNQPSLAPPPIPAWAPGVVPTPQPTPRPVSTPPIRATEARPPEVPPSEKRPAWDAPAPSGSPRPPAPAGPSGEPATPETVVRGAAPDSVLPAERRELGDHGPGGLGSRFQLRWQQIETLEEYGGPAASFAYPAGVNGFDLEHWFMPFLGAGLDSRVLIYDLSVESVRQHRTDASLGTYLALRYPLGILEPSLRAGYMGRTVTVESEGTGTTFPFSPVQTYYGPTVAGKLSVSLLPGFGLELNGKLLPSLQGALYPGFPGIFPLTGSGWGASLVTDVMRGYVSLGYSTEKAANADGTFKQTFGGITLGAGLRY